MADVKQGWSRRNLLRAGPASLLAARLGLGALSSLADAAERVRVKISDVQTMEMQGPVRTYIFVKIIADNGEFGIAEGYGQPECRTDGAGRGHQALADRPGPVGDRQDLHLPGRRHARAVRHADRRLGP
jgi:hypothetical protein